MDVWPTRVTGFLLLMYVAIAGICYAFPNIAIGAVCVAFAAIVTRRCMRIVNRDSDRTSPTWSWDTASILMLSVVGTTLAALSAGSRPDAMFAATMLAVNLGGAFIIIFLVRLIVTRRAETVALDRHEHV